MDLITAIGAGDEFRSWMEGNQPVTVLLPPLGMDPDTCAGRIRDGLDELGLDVLLTASNADDAPDGEQAIRLFPGPLTLALGKALRHPGSFVIAIGDDVQEAAAQIRAAARRAQQETRLAGIPVPGRANVDPELQYAVDRIEIIARLAEDPDHGLVLVDGLFYRTGLDQPASPYEPGKSRAPERRFPLVPTREIVDTKPAPIRVDLAKMAAKLRAEQRIGFVPTWREGTPDDPHVLDGTCPVTFIPEGAEWPNSKGVNLASILHLDVATMPAPARGLLGCETGLFQFFCMRGYDEEMKSFEVRVVDPTGPGTWRSLPDDTAARDAHEHHGPIEQRRVITGWNEVVDAPNGTEFHEGRIRITQSQSEVIHALGSSTCYKPCLEDAEIVASAERNGMDVEGSREVAGLLAHHDSDKLMGWPSWAQAPEWPKGKGSRSMALFLQLSFDHPDAIAPELIAGDGTLQLFVSTEGERRWAMAWACG